MTTAAEGGCLCGAVRYRVTARPARVTICHCRFCQRATGGAYMVQPAIAETDLAVIKGAPKVYAHRSEGSGKEIYIHFCETCGTKLYQKFERFVGAAGVYAGTLDDPNWVVIRAETDKHIFTENARAETLIPAHISIFRHHAIENDGTPKPADRLEAPCRGDAL
jgi:hypothetical protein